MPKPYDYIIVGAGTAGSLLASQLSKQSSRVLLMEAGPSNLLTPLNPIKSQTPWLHVPLGYLYTMTMKSTSYGFKTTVGDRQIEYPRGRTLGGCSSINGMIYQKGNTGDYDGWGVKGWEGSDMMKCFDRIEKEFNWPVNKQRLRWEILDSFGEAVEEKKGLTKNERLVDSEEEGVGYFQGESVRGAK